ncbi:hypothetical protein I5J72_06195 [Pseudomonas aeruginosa]|nr:hypothetical protein [Pseudomonas aeruginosa]
MTKDDLRKILDDQVEQFKNEHGGEVTVYPAQRKPDKQPWKKKPSLRDESFESSLQKTEEQLRKEGRTLDFAEATGSSPARKADR